MSTGLPLPGGSQTRGNREKSLPLRFPGTLGPAESPAAPVFVPRANRYDIYICINVSAMYIYHIKEIHMGWTEVS